MKKRIFLKIFSLSIIGLILTPNIKKILENKMSIKKTRNRYWFLTNND